MIKKVLFLLLLLFSELMSVNAISTCSYYDGYWGRWQTSYFGGKEIFGGYDGFIMYSTGNHPSEYYFKFVIYSYEEPDKATKKQHLKDDTWYEYTGYVEYYVTEQYPTIKDVLKQYDFPCFHCNSGSVGNPCVKRSAKAKIKIAPYKKHPKVYNIWFDGIGVAIDLGALYFNK